MLPVLIAAVTVAATLDLGLDAPWQLLLLLVSGQIGFVLALLWCGLIGGLIGCLTAPSARGPVEPLEKRGSVLGSAGHAGPGSLGGTPSSIRRA
jgi:hypothetical protein